MRYERFKENRSTSKLLLALNKYLISQNRTEIAKFLFIYNVLLPCVFSDNIHLMVLQYKIEDATLFTLRCHAGFSTKLTVNLQTTKIAIDSQVA